MDRNQAPEILVVDDDSRLCDSIAKLLEAEFHVWKAHSGRECLHMIELHAPAVILMDLHMPGMDGLNVLKSLRQNGNELPVIILTAYGSIEAAVKGMHLGAIDFIEKPFDSQRLKRTLRDLFNRTNQGSTSPSKHGIVGDSPELRKSWHLIEKYAPTELPVLLRGETGTGKELFARAVHDLSHRKDGPFVAVDCSTLPENLVESEIFGHEKGAFTGANRAKTGQFEWAHNGTLFLDEIGNAPLAYQMKLLRFLQSCQITPLGGSKTKKIDVRIVCATNEELDIAIAEGRFRGDLYYRIGCGEIHLPSLRSRSGDIMNLIRYFLHTIGNKYNKKEIQVDQNALACLLNYGWPGNVRELEHVMERAIVLANKTIYQSHLHLSKKSNQKHIIQNNGRVNLSVDYDCDFSRPIDLKKLKEETVRKIECQIVSEVKNRWKFKQGELAKFLRIDPKTLRSICKDVENISR